MRGSLGLFEILVILFVALLTMLVVIWPAARICRRTGFSPLLGILAVIPLANVILLWFIAFSRWRTDVSSAS